MTARDFAADTEYLLDRHRLHNRLLHGWGIVCGLDVKPHPNPECAQDWVVVTAGLALDCHGRELVLTHDTPFRLPLRRHDDDDCEDVRREPFLLCARFCQEEVEPTPALYAEGECDPHRKEFNRYRDGVELVVADVTRDCWPMDRCDPCDDDEPREEASSDPEAERHGNHGHGGDCGCGPRPCLSPHCPCGDVVPLARVIPRRHGGYRLDLEGRRVQPPPAALLTHICDVNWPHGGKISLRTLREGKRGELRIRFDRELREYDTDGRGVNPYTFVVQYSTGPAESLEFLPYPDDAPPRLENGHTAVFTIDPDYLNERARRAIVDRVVYVSLRCDFIQDCRGIPVDGTHLRGRLPSGDGVQGGLFESWFRVCDGDDDGDDDRRTES
jgi:hypothetical protein